MLRNPGKPGFTLLEVMITTVIFVSFIAMAMEAQISTTRYAALGESQDQLTGEASTVMDRIADDLSGSGWFFTDLTADYQASTNDRQRHYLPFAQIQDPTGGAMPDALGTTFAYAQRPADDPNSFVVLPPPARLSPPPTGLPADATTRFTDSNFRSISAAARQTWNTSYYARSQELLFAKASISVWDHVHDVMKKVPDDLPALLFSGTKADWDSQAADPATEEAKRARLRILYSSGWSQQYDGSGNIIGYTPRTVYSYAGADPANGTAVGTSTNTPYGVVMESGVLNDPTGDLANIGVNWRTIDGAAYTAPPTDPAERLDWAANVAEYGYMVVRSPFGSGRLLRAVKVKLSTLNPAQQTVGVEVGNILPVRDPAAAGDFRMRVEQVLSDNVVRAVFDTFRTVDADGKNPVDPNLTTAVSTLDYTTVRVRLWFLRRSRSDTNQVVSAIVDRVFTMRAQNNASDKDPQVVGSNASYLGVNPIGIAY